MDTKSRVKFVCEAVVSSSYTAFSTVYEDANQFSGLGNAGPINGHYYWGLSGDFCVTDGGTGIRPSKTWSEITITDAQYWDSYSRKYIAATVASSTVTWTSYHHLVSSANTTMGIVATKNGTANNTINRTQWFDENGNLRSGGDWDRFAKPQDGYVFIGWEGDTEYATIDGNHCRLNPATKADVEIYAVFAARPTITYDTNGGEGTPPEAVSYYGEIHLAYAPVKGNIRFLGWNINGTLYQAEASYTLTEDVTAVAVWEEFTVSVTKSVNAGGTLVLVDVASGEVISREYENVLEFTGAAGVAYRIEVENASELYRQTGVATLENNTFTPSQGQELEYVFVFTAKTLHTLTFGTLSHGSAEILTAPDSTEGGVNKWVDGRRIEIAFTPDEGYDVTAAYLDNADNNTWSGVSWGAFDDNAIVIDSLDFNSRIRATFTAKTYELSAAIDTASATAITAATVTESEAQHGDTVTFSATVATGYVFDGWYRDGQKIAGAGANYEVTVTENMALVAKAKVSVTFSITGDDDDLCSLTVNGATQAWNVARDVVLGESLNYELILGGELQFDSWQKNNVILELDRMGSITPTESGTYTAKVAEVVQKNLMVYLMKIGADATTKENAKDYYGQISFSVVASGNVMENNAEIQPYYYSANGTKAIQVIANPDINFDGGTKQFYGFFADDASLPGAQPAFPQQLLCKGTSYTFLLAENRKTIYAYYGAPSLVDVSIAFGTSSDTTKGEIMIIGKSDNSEGAMIAADGMSATVHQQTTLTLAATAKNGYLFAGWYLDASCNGDPYNTNGVVTVKTSQTLYAKFVADPNMICEWEGSSRNKMMEWRSKTFEASKPFNPSACRVDALNYPVYALTVDMYSAPDATAKANGTSTLTNIASQDARRLPIRRMERYMQICVKHNAEVDAVLVGTSMGGLAS